MLQARGPGVHPSAVHVADVATSIDFAVCYRLQLGMTPLHLAAWYGDETSVGALLKRSADTTAMTQVV